MTEYRRQETKELKFVSQAHWILKSEFATRTCGIILDMSKLAIGAASYKLFVAVRRKIGIAKKLFDSRAPLARSSDSLLFFAIGRYQ